MGEKKTLILGASPNPERYAYLAAERLHNRGYAFVPVGIKSGKVLGQDIIKDRHIQADIDTITLYVNAQNQPEWYDYILDTHPKRIIFNPGTENEELAALAEQQGIETLNACTLVMLSAGTY